MYLFAWGSSIWPKQLPNAAELLGEGASSTAAAELAESASCLYEVREALRRVEA